LRASKGQNWGVIPRLLDQGFTEKAEFINEVWATFVMYKKTKS